MTKRTSFRRSKKKPRGKLFKWYGFESRTITLYGTEKILKAHVVLWGFLAHKVTYR